MDQAATCKDTLWEHGSDFHLMCFSGAEPSENPWDAQSTSYSCGRDAMNALLTFGRKNRGWKRLLVPSYYCQVVVASLMDSGIALALYADSPLDQRLPAADDVRPGDVLLKVNFFGLSYCPDYSDLRHGRLEIIEDHTHDPWSEWACSSRADWCIASLRKTLPLPDGAILWSPARHSLPPVPVHTREREEASAKRLAAMVMKNSYLRGAPVAKTDFRKLFLESEQRFCDSDNAAMTAWSRNLLGSFPVRLLRRTRQQNHACLSTALADVPCLQVLPAPDDSGACPLSCVVVCDTADRQRHLKEALVGSRVYPAVLWPLELPVLDGIPREHRDLSRRLLSFHCDARYGAAEMLHVAELVKRFARQFDAERLHAVDEAAMRHCD